MADSAHFDPNAIGLTSNNIFGLPFSENESELVLLPVPWEVTVSYRHGTAEGPEHLFNAAMQVDLYDPDVVDGWKKGFYMLPVDEDIEARSDFLRWYAETLIKEMAAGRDITSNEQLSSHMQEVNEGGQFLCDWVYEKTSELLAKGKKVGLIGGDHSTPLGFIIALARRHDAFGILQIDAHADLRDAYEGFTFSHASIMHNVMRRVPEVKKLVQLGIRDYCDEEVNMIESSGGRIVTFFDRDIKAQQYEGAAWKQICEQVIVQLPQKVYISFDIDGLDPKLCPNTGTPVPGGFETEQVYYLFRMLHNSGREIIGFDLNEVSEGKGVDTEGIDSITGARVLYKLCNYMVAGSAPR